MKKMARILFVLLLAGILSGCECKHEWLPATCTEPSKCSNCEEIQGEELGHVWIDATCLEARICSTCNLVDGEPNGHQWAEATCNTPKTCVVCGKEEGSPILHAWVAATCTTAKTCSLCGITEGEIVGHKWDQATCTEAKTCSICGETNGEALGHEIAEWITTVEPSCLAEGMKEGICNICNRTETETIPIADHVKGNWDVTIEPTEDEPGEWTLYCAVCGEVMATGEYVLSPEEIKERYISKCTAYNYDTIARDPDEYMFTYGKYTGEVIQVIEDGDDYQLRVNVTKDKYGYSDTIYVLYTLKDGESRILEDDIVTIYGINMGTVTYETVLGASVTIPCVYAEYLDVH